MKRLTKVFLSIAIVCMLAMTIFATSYGPLGTVTITAGSSWTTAYAITDTKAYSLSSEPIAYVNVESKTMWSTPEARIVSTAGGFKVQSESIGLTTGYGQAMNLFGTCTQGTVCYLSVKPGWNQVGNDTITAQINCG